jgi:hypothetical protein
MTEATAVADGLIKQDQRGRMRVTRERRKMLVAEFENSAMTGHQFATLAGIKPTTFSNWVEKPRPKRTRKTVTPLIVHGPRGVRLELGDESQIRLAVQLLRGLGREPEC